MKHTIKFLVIVFAVFCLTSCGKEDYAYYIIEGRLIDKTTKEPIKDIMVSPVMYNMHQESRQKAQKKEPSIGSDYSNTNGEFRTFDQYGSSLLYIYGYSSIENSFYKDTVISVDFSNVPLSGTPRKNYKGDYVLNVGDIELEKWDTTKYEK